MENFKVGELNKKKGDRLIEFAEESKLIIAKLCFLEQASTYKALRNKNNKH